jgi:hypothetical protein
MDTFVIRVWISAEAPAERAVDMRGIVERVADGTVRVFEDATELLDFLRVPVGG